MQTVWKLRVDAEASCLSQVASGLDEYYTGAAEAPGAWFGSGGESLGLAGEVEPADLRAVLAGLAPGTGLTPNGTKLPRSSSTNWLPESPMQPCTSTDTGTSPVVGPRSTQNQLPARYPPSRSTYPVCHPGSESGGDP